MNPVDIAESGLVPDVLLRMGVRRLAAQRLRSEAKRWRNLKLAGFARELGKGPVAVDMDAANRQHYEVPAEFFKLVLGPRLKYSSCYWPERVTTLARAEDAALEATVRHAGIQDGMDILELGCGWGSLTLWLAERFPRCRILGVSNSKTQRAFIETEAGRRMLSNIEIVTKDINTFEPGRRFDRVVSVEMFEHVRNHEVLMGRIAGWLNDGGKLFVHIFCHRRYAYLFETQGADNWMGRNFFTGGIMPSADLLAQHQKVLVLQRSWTWGGEHYQKTSEAWLKNLDARHDEVFRALQPVYGTETDRWIVRWRLFFIAVAELFGYGEGTEWQVAHYLFGKR